MQELIIRIKALAGRAFSFTEAAPKEVTDFEIGDYRFNSVTQRLSYVGTAVSPHADTEVELSHRESEILKRLCENRNQVVNTQNVLLDLWGDDSFSIPAACTYSSPNYATNLRWTTESAL